MRRVTLVVLHCSASKWGSAEKIDEWHRKQGWEAIGYHYVVGNGYPRSSRNYVPFCDGLIELGRDLNKNGWSEDEVGSHVKRWNKNSVGICLVGPPFSNKQLGSAARLAADICQRYMLDPTTSVKGHNEFPEVIKQCPMVDMGEFRHYVSEALKPGGIAYP
jgi:N-acetylmuramoyl-L-alanine amidase